MVKVRSISVMIVDHLTSHPSRVWRIGLVLLLLLSVGLAACSSSTQHRNVWVVPHRSFTVCASADCGQYAATLYWDVTISGVTGYNVFVNGAQIDTDNASPYTFQGLDCGQTFQLGVQAHDGSGHNNPSNGPANVSYTTPSCATSMCPQTAANTPDGPDPWGGCFPGPLTTGVPSGTTLTTVSTNGETAAQAVTAGAPADNTGWTYSTTDGGIDITSTGAVVDAVTTSGVNDNTTGATATVKNSQINGVVQSNSNNNGLMLITHDSINGGAQTTLPDVYTDNIDVEFSNVSGGKDMVHCAGGDNCTVQNSYLNNNSTSDPSSHQQGYEADGMNNGLIQHNTIGCIGPSGQCTADITISTDGADTNLTINHNLLLPSNPPGTMGVCVVPGPNASGVSVTLYNINITNNVFQKGASGGCGTALFAGQPVGWLYDWWPSRCETTTQAAPPSNSSNTSCTFTGNVADDGTPIVENFQ